MDTPLNTAVATPQPAAPAAPPTPPAPVAPVTPAPSSTGGGNSITSILKSLNWIEMGFGILGATALYYTIFYYKYSNSLQKSIVNEMQNKYDELSVKVNDISSAMESKKDPVSSQLFF